VRETERAWSTPCLSLSAGRSIHSNTSPSEKQTRKQKVTCSLPYITKHSVKAQTVHTSKTNNDVPHQPQIQTKRSFTLVCSFTNITGPGSGMGNRGIVVQFPARARDFLSSAQRPERPWGRSSLLYNGHPGNFPGDKVAAV